MTDRELLEAAAKAAGYVLTWGGVYKLGDDIVDCTDFAYIRSGEPDVADMPWDPLSDDGDALRLAVKLEMDVLCASVRTDCGIVETIHAGTDIYSATRRAIVRAAAAIGGAKP